MQREILFRGKRVDNGKWVEGDRIIEPYGVVIQYYEGNKRIRATVILDTVGQYTGLTDKNGNKIFEGDIIYCIDNGIEHLYTVIWDKEEIDFKATNGKEMYGRNFVYLCCCEEIEIIGNIYNNPELLEV